jgi:extracellular factor (EF) 3-hydroxypalmitic acid methyl ester biosynthesis protein
LDITLFDQDPDALERAQSLLNKVQESHYHIRKIQESVYSIAKRNSLSGRRFDVIYSMGLFDYLPQDFARVLTHRIFPLLTPGGELIIANCSDNPVNPDRFFMEYALDWFLRQRSDNAMKELVSGLPARSTKIYRDDETRTITFLHVVSNNIENP